MLSSCVALLGFDDDDSVEVENDPASNHTSIGCSLHGLFCPTTTKRSCYRIGIKTTYLVWEEMITLQLNEGTTGSLSIQDEIIPTLTCGAIERMLQQTTGSCFPHSSSCAYARRRVHETKTV